MPGVKNFTLLHSNYTQEFGTTWSRMAALFGAVASGIGIAGVAAQAIDGIRKLQNFCNDVRDAPEEITYMTNELEILLGTIAGIEVQIQRNASICQTLNPT
jgi:hypothetical protein